MVRSYKRFIFYTIFTLLITGCFGVGDNDFDPIVAEYNIEWIDTEETRSVCKGLENGDRGGETVVPEYVFAVGHNDRYIFGKQHPLDSANNQMVDLKTTNYFVVDYTKHPYARQDGIYDPMNWDANQKLNTELGIGEIAFDMIYPDSPQ